MSTEVVDQVHHANVKPGPRQSDAADGYTVHGSGHVAKDMLNPAAWRFGVNPSTPYTIVRDSIKP